jgi:hypothetical protein
MASGMLKVIVESIRESQPDMTDADAWLLGQRVFKALLREGWATAWNA